MSNFDKTILLWTETEHAPQEIVFDRDDVDFVVAIPPGMEIPWRLRQLSGPDNDAKVFHIRKDGVVEKEQWVQNANDQYWGPTEYRVPVNSPYIDYTILICSHS